MLSGLVAAVGLAACGAAAEVQDVGSATTGDATTGDAPAPPAADSTTDPETDESGSGEGTGDSDGDSSDGSPGDPLLGPPYPIVLAHGFFGFDDLAGIDPLTYFFGVPEALAEAGESLVFTPAVDPFNDSTVRGVQLLAHVQEVLLTTGYDKVVIIGHSQGGLDARVVASLRPDLVAAVVTIATPHYGTPVADVALGLVDDPAAQSVIDAVVNFAGVGLWEEVDGNSSLALSMQQMSTPGITAFNEMYPDSADVRYASLTGRSSLAAGGEACAAPDNAPEFITDWEDERDPIDPLFSATAAFLSGSVLTPAPNDGLVLVDDAKWGEFLGCIPADHPDQIGHFLGDLPGVLNGWRHDTFFVELVAWVRAEGL